MSEKLFVKAQEGQKCPREKGVRPHIDDSKFVPVDNNRYYRGLIRDKSLVQKIATQPAAKK